jgi:hypothetical protein
VRVILAENTGVDNILNIVVMFCGTQPVPFMKIQRLVVNLGTKSSFVHKNYPVDIHPQIGWCYHFLDDKNYSFIVVDIYKSPSFGENNIPRWQGDISCSTSVVMELCQPFFNDTVEYLTTELEKRDFKKLRK